MEWISDGRAEYLDVFNATMGHEAVVILDRLWPNDDEPVSPADLYMKVIERAKELYEPYAKGSTGNAKTERYYRYTQPQASDFAPAAWEDGELIPTPQRIEDFVVVSAAGNHISGWRVLIRHDGRWKVLEVDWKDNRYEVQGQPPRESYANFTAGYAALIGANFMDHIDRNNNSDETISHIDTLLNAEMYRLRTGNTESKLSERDVRYLMDRRQHAIDRRQKKASDATQSDDIAG